MTFEEWWNETGQETLYALNTLTDADAKILAKIAWESASAQPVKQEPVVWKPIETAPRHGRILVTGTDIGTCVASAGWNNDTPDDIRWEVVNDIVVHPTHWMPLPTWIQPFNAVGCYYGAADHIGHVVRLDVELPIGTTLYASNSSVKDMSDNAIAKPICTGAVGHFIHNEGQQFVQRLTGKFFKGKK